MFGKDSITYRIDKLEKEVAELKNMGKKDPVMTDPVLYVDAADNRGSYRRIGNIIEFTAVYPPSGIDIKTDTLRVYSIFKTAEVIGWGSNLKVEKI